MNSNMADVVVKYRKQKGMTQKQLAEKLGVTDKAVSKWERGNGYPDISYLEPLADALGINISDLVKGETETDFEEIDDEDSDEKIVKSTLAYANSIYEKKSKKAPRIAALSSIGIGLAGIMTTSIVDNYALNSNFTWSLIPISAIIFLWLCILPSFVVKKHKFDAALLSSSVFIIPFLGIMCNLTNGKWFSSVAIPMSIVGIITLWIIRFLFATKLTVWNKLAISLLIAAVVNVLIAFLLGNILFDGGFDVWNLMSVAILLVIAVIFFAVGYSKKSKN